MITFIKNRRQTLLYRVFCSLIVLSFAGNIIVPPTPVTAQSAPLTILNLPSPETLITLTPGFNPPMIQGITVHPDNPLKFNFLISPGDNQLDGKVFRDESKRLIKYFLAGLTVPDEELWVNLSPFEQNRIITEMFGLTEMGRDMLAQDYMLKQLSASLMYPENDLGRSFWNRVYKRAYEEYGSTEIPMNTFNKIWIVPEKAVVYEHGNTAYVVESHLKVMLEEDYVALNRHLDQSQISLQGIDEDEAQIRSGVMSKIVKEILIPEIEREVNYGAIFTHLRQIYNSIILATWYKDNVQKNLLGNIYVNKGKTKGIDNDDPQVNKEIYAQYLEAFKNGVYNYIREDFDPRTQQLVPRKYFSGGNNFGKTRALRIDVTTITPEQGRSISSPVKNVEVVLYEQNPTNDAQIAQADEAFAETVSSTVTFDSLQAGDSVTFAIKKFSDYFPGFGSMYHGIRYTAEVAQIYPDNISLSLRIRNEYKDFTKSEFLAISKIEQSSSPVRKSISGDEGLNIIRGALNLYDNFINYGEYGFVRLLKKTPYIIIEYFGGDVEQYKRVLEPIMDEQGNIIDPLAHENSDLRERITQIRANLTAIDSKQDNTSSSPITDYQKVLSDLKSSLLSSGFKNGDKFSLETAVNITGHKLSAISLATSLSNEYRDADEPGYRYIQWNNATSSPVTINVIHNQLREKAERDPAFNLSEDWVLESSKEVGYAHYSVIRNVYVEGFETRTIYTAINAQTNQPVGKGYVLDARKTSKDGTPIIEALLDATQTSSSPIADLQNVTIHNFITPHTLEGLINNIEEINPTHVDLKSAKSLMNGFNSDSREEAIINLAYWLPRLQRKTMEAIHTDINNRIQDLNEAVRKMEKTRYLSENIAAMQKSIYQAELNELMFLSITLSENAAVSNQTASSPIKYFGKLATTVNNMEVPKSDINLFNEGDLDYADPEIDKYTLSATFRLYDKVGDEFVSQVRHSVSVRNKDEQRNLIDEVFLLMGSLRQDYAQKTISSLDKDNNALESLLLDLHRYRFPDLHQLENNNISVTDPVITLLSEGLKKLELHTILIDYKNHGISEFTTILNNLKNKSDVREFLDDLTPIALDNNLVDSARARVIEKLNLLDPDHMQLHFIDSISVNTYPETALERLTPIISFNEFSDDFRLKALNKLMQFDSRIVSGFLHDIIYKLADEKAYNDFLVIAIIEEINRVSRTQNELNPDWAYVLQTVLLVPSMDTNIQENAIRILAEYNTEESKTILKNIQNTISKNGNDQKYDPLVQHAVVKALIQVDANSSSSPIKSNLINQNENPGGIDLNPALMHMEIKRDGNGVPLPLNLQPMEIMNIEGLIPVIINVTPVTNLPMLLGLDMNGLEEQPVNSANARSMQLKQEHGLRELYRQKYVRKYTEADI